MKTSNIALLVSAVLSVSSIANATIAIYTYGGDGDGAIVTSQYTWENPSETLTIAGHQYGFPADIVGDFRTDTPLDPTMTLRTAVDNDTTFAWTDYHVTVYMSSPFTIASPTVYSPGDWTSTITQQPVWDGTRFQGQVDYFAGTPVSIGGTIDFSYQISFSGSTQYSFCQTLVPTPEPGTVTLLGIGALLFGVMRRRS